MLSIQAKGSRAILSGPIDDRLEKDLRRRFSWQNPEDLDDILYWYADGIMYSGVMLDVQEFLAAKGVECEIHLPEMPKGNAKWQFTRTYRPMQEAAVDAAFESRYGVIHAPPGSGKTSMMAGVLCKAGLKGFVVTPNERPFTQAYNTLKAHTTIPDIGSFSGNHKHIGDVTVVTIQSLNRQLTDNPTGPLAKAWGAAQVVLIDEAHHSGADSHISAFEELSDVKIFCGFTATPKRPDYRQDWLEAMLGRVIYRITRGDAIEHRLSVPLTVFVDDMTPMKLGLLEKHRENPNAPRRRGQQSPYEKAYDAYITNNRGRNSAGLNFCQEAVDNGLTCVLSVRYIQHIERLKELNGNVVALSGKTPMRDEMFENMQQGKLPLVASTLMDEAVDVASLSCVAMMAGGKSSVKLEQRIRCDRVFDGMTVTGYFAKDRGYVWFPYDRCDFLTSHSKQNLDLLKEIVREHPAHEMYLNGKLIIGGTQRLAA